MDAEFNWQTVVRFAAGTAVWAFGVVALSIPLEWLGLRPFWLLFPVSALLATLLGYALKLPNIHTGGLADRKPDFRVWLVQQLVTWTLLGLVLWLVWRYIQ